MRKTFDFVTFGGGPAGAAFALGAATAGATVAVIDRPRLSPKFGEIFSSSVLVPLHQLGISEDFFARRCLPSYGNLSLWESGAPVERSSLFGPYGPGWHVDRDEFETWLLNLATERGAVIVRSRAVSAKRAGSGWQVAVGHWTFNASFAIEATGRALGVVIPSARNREDRLIGLLAYIPICAGDDDSRLYLEAVDLGWWYSALLPNGRIVLALMTDATLLPKRAEARYSFFQAALTASRITRLRAPSLNAFHTLYATPANSAIRSVIGSEAALAIGDAAASYDPLCGQGVVAALSKGAAAARLLCGNGPRATAVREYVDAEHEAFSTYRRVRAGLYAAAGRQSEFWRMRKTNPSTP